MKKTTIIGLTGSIGMGKSTVLGFLKKARIPVLSADETVHALLKRGGKAVPKIAKLFPDSLIKGAIDRKKLGEIVFGEQQALEALEKIIHPLVAKEERAFIKEARAKNKKTVVIEIPLLFETKSEKRCDVTLCLTAPKKTQRERVLARPGMTPRKLNAIMKRQMSETEKKRRADFIINTGCSEAETKAALFSLLSQIQGLNK